MDDSGPWAPLRQRAFRWLSLGIFISSVGTWMQTVGAQWLLVDAPNAAALVSLVAAANTLPVMLLALPGGVLADSFDRRWLLLSVQAYFFGVGVLLAVLTAAAQMPPALLLAFTFALGTGVALQLPAWGASIPELVPRSQLRAASRLDLVNVNLARAIGPAVAGLVIAHLGGVPAVFALNAASVLFLAVAVLLWRRRPTQDDAPRERFVPALRAGGRYVWNDPVVRRIMLRLVVFVAPGVSLWALLPLIATQRLGLGADGYGLLFGALGIGAVLAAAALGHVKGRPTTNGLLTLGGAVYAAAVTMVVLVRSFPVALAALVLAGLGWMTVTSTLGAELQLVLPVWVRARGIALYTVMFMGAQTGGALVWGLLANRVGPRSTVLFASGVVAAGVVVGTFRRVPDTAHFDPAPASYWGEARMAVDPEPGTGPVLVAVHYTVVPDQQTAYLHEMERLSRSRLRTGATRWELYRDGLNPDRFVELFRVSSWEEHQRQHAGRLTSRDQQVEEAALAFSDPPATVDHLLPP